MRGESISRERIDWCVCFVDKARGTSPIMETTGSPSVVAVASGVQRFDEPGPEVAMHTPGVPVRRPTAAAMKPAFCSCRHTISLISGWSRSALKTASILAPGMPKTYFTPAACRLETRRTATPVEGSEGG